MPLYEQRQKAMGRRQEYAGAAASAATRNAMAGAASQISSPAGMLANQRLKAEAQGHTKAHFDARQAVADREAEAVNAYNDQVYRWAQLALDEANGTFDRQMRERELGRNFDLQGQEMDLRWAGLNEDSRQFDTRMGEDSRQFDIGAGLQMQGLDIDKRRTDNSFMLGMMENFAPKSVVAASRMNNPAFLRERQDGKQVMPGDEIGAWFANSRLGQDVFYDDRGRMTPAANMWKDTANMIRRQFPNMPMGEVIQRTDGIIKARGTNPAAVQDKQGTAAVNAQDNRVMNAMNAQEQRAMAALNGPNPVAAQDRRVMAAMNAQDNRVMNAMNAQEQRAMAAMNAKDNRVMNAMNTQEQRAMAALNGQVYNQDFRVDGSGRQLPSSRPTEARRMQYAQMRQLIGGGGSGLGDAERQLRAMAEQGMQNTPQYKQLQGNYVQHIKLVAQKIKALGMDNPDDLRNLGMNPNNLGWIERYATL